MMQIFDSYLNYLQFEKHYSTYTFVSYKSDLLQFFNFLKIDAETNKVLTQVTISDVREWIIDLSKQGISARSVNRKITSLKSFFKYCLKQKVVTENPAETISSLKTSKNLPTYVEEINMNELFEDESIFENDFYGLRDKMIIALLYHTGIRESELINLTLDKVDFTDNTIQVTGKRNKQRIIPILSDFMQELKNYTEKRNSKFDKTIPYIFITNKGNKMYPKFVYRLVNKYLSKITTLSKKSPHVIRHTFATHMLNNGADLNAIKELLGHVNLAATQIYTHNSFEKLKKTYSQTHPRN